MVTPLRSCFLAASVPLVCLAGCSSPGGTGAVAHDHGHSHENGHGHGHDGADHVHDAGAEPVESMIRVRADAPAAPTFAHTHLHPGGSDPDICWCEDAKLVNGWCEHHDQGWVGGVEVESDLLFETLDPHGHDIALHAVTCPTCLVGMEYNGWCESCRFGWHDQKVYFTRLSYRLAYGDAVRPSSLACPTCRENTIAWGFCGDCHAGQIGPFRFTDREEFDAATAELPRLHYAIAMVPNCDLCACALMVDGRCPTCRVQYQDGVAVFGEDP